MESAKNTQIPSMGGVKLEDGWSSPFGNLDNAFERFSIFVYWISFTGFCRLGVMVESTCSMCSVEESNPKV